MLIRSLTIFAFVVSSGVALAMEPDVKCVSYADYENGVEIEVAKYIGTISQVIIGGKVPTALGSSYLTDDILRDTAAYTFFAAPAPYLNSELMMWPLEPVTILNSTGFKGEFRYGQEVIPAACNWN